jgi:hypothetical protein
MVSRFDAGRGLFEFFVGTGASCLLLLVETADFIQAFDQGGGYARVTAVATFSRR